MHNQGSARHNRKMKVLSVIEANPGIFIEDLITKMSLNLQLSEQVVTDYLGELNRARLIKLDNAALYIRDITV